MKTFFEQITHWKTIGEWESIKNRFPSAETLERYYNIYQFILTYYPERKRGYRIKAYKDSRFVKRFGNQIDDVYIHKAISVMEKRA